MTYKKGITNLRSYIKNEKESSEINEGEDNMQIAVKNQKRWNAMILEDILQELETEDLKLSMAFSGPKATDLPHLSSEPFEEKGIKIEYKGGVYSASLESAQIEYVVFWVSNVIGIASGSISIADFIYNKLKNHKNTKIRVGENQISTPYTLDDIRKVIREELERLKKE